MATSLPEPRPVSDPPKDGITSLSYMTNNLVASTSWDGSVRLHDTVDLQCKLSHFLESGPLLSLATPPGGNRLVAGGMDGSIRSLDIATTTSTLLGQHSGVTQDKLACSCLKDLDANIFISAGWDSNVHVWDARAAGIAVATVTLPGKAFGMDIDVSRQRIVVATSGRRNCFIDIRTNGATTSAELIMDRESSLKYQTRTVKFFPDGTAIALGSIEGRVAVEYLDDIGVDAAGKKKYAFKCHRQGDIVYPVNCIAFNPRFGTFATGGCDGTVVTWDGANKKKLTSLPKFATSIAALAFNMDGSELAIASSYTFEEGEREHPRDEIFIRSMLDSECQPKAISK